MNDSEEKRIGHLGRFIDHGDGTVTDTQTDLMWMRPSLGQVWTGTMPIGLADRPDLNTCLALSHKFANHSDWRIPSLDELISLVDFIKNKPTIDTTVFPRTNSETYWTSSPKENNNNELWQIDFNSGQPRHEKSHTNAYIRLVRINHISPKVNLIKKEILEKIILNTKQTGSGSGVITRSIDADNYINSTSITLTAIAHKGSEFKRWHGAATGSNPSCTVTMDFAKTVSAEFVKLESFPLYIKITGTGRGHVKRSDDAQAYYFGSKLTLTALADKGSIFNGWHGDISGLNETSAIIINSATSINAEFEKTNISDTAITAELKTVKRVEIKREKFATIFELTLRNNSEQQVRVKVPLTNYVSLNGQTTEQSGWTTEHVNGSKGVTLSPGNFCEMGLINIVQPKLGDKLYINVEQLQPSSRSCFTFRCTSTGNWSTFVLVQSSVENQKEIQAAKENLPAIASALNRIESLEKSLAEVLHRLDNLQKYLPRAIGHNTSHQAAPAQTLSEVLAWMAEHDHISISELRARFLPLDLLPSAVIDEINEQALDLTGETALEIIENEIIIKNNILHHVIKINY